MKLEIKTMLGVLFALAIYGDMARGQPPVQEFDKRIVASDFFKDEWGDSYGICEVPRLTAVTDVTGPFTGGQCLKRNSGNTAWVGGQCGTGGGSGFDFDSASADQQHNWVFPIGQKPLTASINFRTGACPSGWGTNCWSAEPRAIVGSYTGSAPPSDIVLISNTRIAYASATDKRATSVWVGSTQYPVEFIAHNGTLGVREVVYSTLQTQIPGTNWQNVRFEFSDGSFSPATEGSLVQRTADKEELIDYLGLQDFSPSQDNIYPPTKAILKSGTNISLDHSDTNNTITINSTATGGSSSEGDGRFIALETTPTDLRSYANGQVLRVNTPAPGKWLEVQGADANERHSFRTVFEADSANPAQATWAVGTDLNYGYSSFGDVFGKLYTADGGKAFTVSNTPIMRMEIEQEVATVTPNVGGNIYGFTTTYTLLIRKTDLATAPATIYVRYYTGPPASGNQVTTVQFNKGADNSAHAYHTYIDSSGADINTEDILSIKYFSLFTSNPPTGDQTSNPLQLHDAKSLEEIDKPAVGLRNTSVSVDVTQRIVNIGRIKSVDKSAAWRTQGLQRSPHLNGYQGYMNYTRLASGDPMITLGGSAQQNGSLFANDTGPKFYKLQFSSDKTDLTVTEITLDTGVAYPANFPIYRFKTHTLPDGKVLVMGGAFHNPTASYYLHREYNTKFYILTINETTNKITNIRTLSHVLTASWGNLYNKMSAFNLSNGDVVIFSYSQRLIENGSTNSDKTSRRVNLIKLTIGETTDSIVTLLNNVIAETFVSGFDSEGNTNGSTDNIEAFKLIKKTNYYYLLIYANRLKENVVRVGEGIVKFPINNPTSATYRVAENSSIRFGRDYVATLLNGDLIYFLNRTNPPNSYSILKSSISISEVNAPEATENPSPVNSLLNTHSYFVRTYTTDEGTPRTLFYTTLWTFVSRDGSLGILRSNRQYDGGSSIVWQGLSGYWYVDIEGDTQVVVNRQYASQVASVEGHELTYGVAFPITSLKNDTHVFDQDVASGLTWRDTDGTTSLTSAKTGDVAVYNGTNWVKKPLSMATVASQVPQQFRSDADTTGQLFQPKCFWLGTSTQLTAVSKSENCLYFVPKTSQ